MPLGNNISVLPGEGIRYVVPQLIDPIKYHNEKQNFFMRSTKPMEKARLFIESDKDLIRTKVLFSI
jgi:hypothetical protein